MRKYLLVDLEGQSRRGSPVSAASSTNGRPLSSEIMFRNIWECADSPVLSTMINPMHAESIRPRLFELRGNFAGPNPELRRICEVSVPQVSPAQKLAFALYCVRTLSPESAFGAWTERWLANIDRSVVGAKLMRRELEKMAGETDRSRFALAKFGVSASHLQPVYDSEFDFVRRALDVVDAAITFAEKPRQWHVTLAELVATATSNLVDEAQKCEFAELAVCVIPAETRSRQMAEPKRLLRRRDDAPARRRAKSVHKVFQSGNIKITASSRSYLKG
jgi:hypothetical protein